MEALKPIHPFPARMAPEIALNALSTLPTGSMVLDPMVGSGTVLRMASEFKHRGIGFDMDPLAVLMTKVWTTPIDIIELKKKAKEIIGRCKVIYPIKTLPDWIENDSETKNFVNYWFAEEQKICLSHLSKLICEINNSIGDALKIAFSRLIITKDRGASLARDVSHSRPHRVRQTNDFNVLEEFRKSVNFLIKRFEEQIPNGNIHVRVGDSRDLRTVKSDSVDAVLTSPPYLNAVDYLRGHKLSLVWLGYKISEIKVIRSESIGAEKAYEPKANITLAEKLIKNMGELEKLSVRQIKMIKRYVLDLYQMIKEIHRTLKPNNKSIFVIGNSCLSGVFIKNTQAIRNAAQIIGFEFIEEWDRNLPANRRYLPPPTTSIESDFGKRMRTESVMTFVKPIKPVCNHGKSIRKRNPASSASFTERRNSLV